jgi:SAM-dependent methyltransferase
VKSLWHWPIPGGGSGQSHAVRAERSAHRIGDVRTREQLYEHYLIECELADRLRHAPRSQRPGLYCEVYDELFRRVRHHPQLHDVNRAPRQREIDGLLALLRGFLTSSTVLMEVGAGDCELAIRAAAIVKQVYAVDVSEQITRRVSCPANFRLVLSDGCSIPVPEGGIDVAVSNQLMEHLHPDDAREQLRNIYRSLAPGGVYMCITPNRVYGPHDISMHFDEVATGFHLLEYSARDLRQLFGSAGFTEMRFYAGARGIFLRVPFLLIALVEAILGAVPRRHGKRIAETAPLRALLGLRVAAMKPWDL